MRFRVLGPVEASGETGPIALGGPKQRLVLAHLVLAANRIVTREALIDALWGEEPPGAARGTLQAYVSRLRSALGAERIEGRPPGYALRAEPEEIDALRFEMLVHEARRTLPLDPRAAADLLAQAEALWRGPALGDLSSEPSLQGEIARLDELRSSASEDRIVAELELGRHTKLVSELEALTSRHPLRERLWGHLMLALYRSGRQGEALSVFDRARE
ncbi:MAG TPA: AfsR/SARP family transcriptional regulator, partial [Actinomycetota bacterium]|nr:AfsR/SARP family transcriptional regulator [Actinomycetota bacterium]